MSKPLARVRQGEVFGRWIATKDAEPEGRYLKVRVKCACGNTGFVEQASLRKGVSISCGCWSKEVTSALSTKHGKRGSPIYPVWNTLVQRCTNPKNDSYKNYGARGITVCDEWLTFEGFYKDMGDPPFAGATIERKKNAEGYSKANCVWATKVEQARNKRNTIKYEYQGEERTLQEIADLCGQPYMRLYQRLFTYNWPFEKAVKP